MIGRELDALVSEKLMDKPVIWREVLEAWTQGEGTFSDMLHGRGTPRFARVPCEDDIAGAVAFMDYDSRDFGCKLPLVPHYSDEIGAAWSVVTTMNRRAYDFVLRRGEQSSASFIHRHDPMEAVTVNADSSPLAICLAALKAIGVEAA